MYEIAFDAVIVFALYIFFSFFLPKLFNFDSFGLRVVVVHFQTFWKFVVFALVLVFFSSSSLNVNFDDWNKHELGACDFRFLF